MSESTGAAPVANDTVKVLVIDDSKTIRRSAENLLSKEGYDVITATDGFDALAKIADARPEIIFVEDGEGTMRVGDQTVSIRPGTFLYIPPRTDHDFRPTGNRPLRAMQMYAPSGPEQRFRPEPAEGTDQAGTWQAGEGEPATSSQEAEPSTAGEGATPPSEATEAAEPTAGDAPEAT